MNKVKEIRCQGCGQIRRWAGFECLDTCPCLEENPEQLGGMSLRKKIGELLNSENSENGSNTPDWILANYLLNCLSAFDEAVNQREGWYGRQPTESIKGKEEV